VVRELTDQAGPSSRAYLLSNGMTRVEYYEQPVNYVDPNTHQMTPIDSGLQDTVVAGREVSTNKANAFQLQFPQTLSGDWVSIETTAFKVALRPASRAGSKAVAFAPQAGVTATTPDKADVAYAGAFSGASLSYESRADGMKETITLSSAPSAATIYSFDLKPSGLVPRLEADGSVSLLRSGETTPSLVIPRPCMWDSSRTSALSNAVHYELSGSAPVYRLDVVPDQRWLADSARVYPVMIDPGVLVTTATPTDTYISSESTATRAANYSTNPGVHITNRATGYNYTDHAIVQATSALASDLSTRMFNDNEYVYAASLKYYCSSVPYATSITAYGTETTVAIGSVTWNSQPTTRSIGSPAVSMTTAWNTFDITSEVADWQQFVQDYTACNIELQAAAGGRMLFNSKEFGTTNLRPVMTVDYAPFPSAKLNAPQGGQFTSAPQANWTYSEALGNPQVEYHIEVRNPSDGSVVATSGQAGNATSAPLPVPPGGWGQGRQYEVGVATASRPLAGGPEVWSFDGVGTFTMLDSIAPTSAASAGSSYFGTATISLSATDNAGGSGVAGTYYTLDASPTPTFSCTGGLQSINGTRTVVTFTNSGSLVCSGSLAGASMLVVGGGGGGKGNLSGGGGGGGVVTGTITLSGSMPINVGAGGAVGDESRTAAYNGGDSIIKSGAGVTLADAVGGGRGGARDISTGSAGASGGSGGGGGSKYGTQSYSGGSGTAGQGFGGGSGTGPTDLSYSSAGGGGGGAGGAGSNGASQVGGKGGAGATSTISGAAVSYGGGGGGGSYNDGGLGGRGGGGNGDYLNSSEMGSCGAASTGGGGGGSSLGAGGCGIVILSYPTPAAQRVGTTVTVAPPTSGTVAHTICYWSVDKAGNAETAHFKSFTVTADKTAPTTTSDAVSSYNGTATISLTATDNVGGSGVAATYYRVDGGAQLVGTVVAVSPPASGITSHTVSFWSTDNAGNVETAHAVSFTITPRDTTPPTTTSNAIASYNGTATISLTATDNAGGSGLANTYFVLDGGVLNTGTTLVQPPGLTLPTTVTAVFGYTGSSQTYTVPAGVTSVTVTITGAGGGGGGAMWYDEGGPGTDGSPGAQSSVTLGGASYAAYGGGGGAAADNGGAAGSAGGTSMPATWTTTVGGGGAGGRGGTDDAPGGRGGAGGRLYKAILAVTPGQVFTLDIGAGGAGGEDGDSGYFPGHGGSGADGSAVVSYVTSGGVPGPVLHTLQFWSSDLARNVETTKTVTFTVSPYRTPAPTSTVAVVASTTSSAWFDASSGAPDDTNAGGRGSVGLSWSPVAGASSYNIYLLDGAIFQRVGTTSALSWTSAGAGIYPTDSQIASLSAGTTGCPYPQGTGLDLRDDPTALYAKMAGSTVAGVPAYFFKVTAASAGGETTLSAQPTTTVQLSGRTVHVSEAPAHTTRDLGSIAGDSGFVQLDNGALVLSATDLSVASFGPAAALARTYRSTTTSATTFAAGWRFNFEQSVTASGTCLIYTDDTGEAYRFTPVPGQSAWASPHGMVATITVSAQTGPYTLSLKGGTTLSFDTSGRLTAETDRHSDTTGYAWSQGQLVISAANDSLFDHHQIIVTLDGTGHVTSATNSQDGLTREVDYANTTGVTATVTRHLSAAETATVVYSYASSPTTQLVGVSVPGFAPGGVTAAWSFSYDAMSTRLAGMQYPTTTVARPLAIAYPTATSASVAYLARVGNLASSDSTVTETFLWDACGRQIAHGNPSTEGSRDGTATTDYGPSGEPKLTVTAARVTKTSVTDFRGNELFSWDALGNATTNVYNSTDDLISTTDPRGAQTLYTYNTANGDMLTESQQLNATDTAVTTWTFGSAGHGRPDAVSKSITATASEVTQYSGYGDFTEPQYTTEKAVALDSTSGVTYDLTTQRTYDGFGLLVSETDPTNVAVTTNAYNLSGHLILSTDAIGTVVRHRYNVLGSEVETSRTASVGWADWTSKTMDPTGLVLTECSYVVSGSATAAVGVTMHLYDGNGQEIKAAVSDAGTTTTAYDSKGDISASWQPGVSTTDTSTAQTTVSDADQRAVAAAAPAAAATDQPSALTTYGPGMDQVAAYKTPAVSVPATFGYDAVGNQTTETIPTSSGATSTSSSYDLGGRQTSSTDASGNITTTAYDLLGRATKTTLRGADTSSTATYNSLGWVLTTTDPSGVLTRNVYDKDGRLTDQASTVSGAPDAPTHHDFDLLGHEINTSNPDGSSLQTTFDAFGRSTRAVQFAGGVKVHDDSSLFDESGRTLESSDTVTGIRTVSSFATSVTSTSIVTKTLADATITVAATAAGNETTQTFNIIGMPGSGVLTTNVKSRNNAQAPLAWAVVLPGYASFSRGDVFDSQGRVILQMDQTGATYNYDSRTGRETAQSIYGNSLLPSQDATYTYTDEGRVASATVNTSTTNYVFDGAGQIVAAGLTSLGYAAGRLATSTVGGVTTTYSFDARGRRTSQALPSQAATFTWDPKADRLTGYCLDRAPLGSTDVTATFAYDAAGQRTGSVVTSGGVTTTSAYMYEGLQLTRLVSASVGVTTTLTYLYDEMGRPLVIAASFSDTSAVYPVSPQVDAHGDVLGILDMDLKPIVSWANDIYGNPSVQATAATALVPSLIAARIVAVQPLRYAGYAYDSFSGLYYCSQRYYDPASMQFISADAGKADGEGSAYQYCSGDPVGAVDPTGASASSLNVPPVTKHKQRWSWAAAAVSVVRYLTGGWIRKTPADSDWTRFKKAVPKLDWSNPERLAQDAFVWQVKGSLLDYEPNVTVVKNGLVPWISQTSGKMTYLTLKGVQSQIDNRWPILSERCSADGFYSWDVICGYDDSSITVMRPGPVKNSNYSTRRVQESYRAYRNDPHLDPPNTNGMAWIGTVFDLGKVYNNER
jgi:RHS repeat-associated protein